MWWGVDEFAVDDGGFDDVADCVHAVCEAGGVVDCGFEGEFHSGARGGVLGDLMCEGSEGGCQLLPCCGAADDYCVADGFVDGAVPVGDEAPCDGFSGLEVEIDDAFCEYAGGEDGLVLLAPYPSVPKCCVATNAPVVMSSANDDCESECFPSRDSRSGASPIVAGGAPALCGSARCAALRT